MTPQPEQAVGSTTTARGRGKTTRFRPGWVSILLLIRVAATASWALLNNAEPAWVWVSGLLLMDGLLLVACAHRWWSTGLWRWSAMSMAVLGVAAAQWSWFLGDRGVAAAALGATVMWLGLVAGVGVLRLALSPGWPVLAVARTLIDEAVRTRLVPAFGLGVLLIVAVLPVLLDPAEMLKYRVQFFLTWSLSSVAVLLSLLTVVLACGTICNEIAYKQIFLTLTKPVGRGQYLMGKWLGVVALDLLLVGVAGVGVCLGAKSMQRQPGRDDLDRQAVDRQVLVAREAVWAQPPMAMDFQGLIGKYVEQLRSQEPERFQGRQADAPLRDAAEQMAAVKWHTIAPRDSQRYFFSGLKQAKADARSIQLRIKPTSARVPDDGIVRLAIWLNGRPYPVDAVTGRQSPLVLADGNYHVIDLPAAAIDDRGGLDVRIANVNLLNPNATFPSSVAFAPGEGLQVFYQVGPFGPNLARAMLLVWLRLCFLAMFGLMAGSFLGFPVACLLSVMVYVVATASGFLAEAVRYYGVTAPQAMSSWEAWLWIVGQWGRRLSEGQVWETVKITVKLVGQAVMLLVPSLGEYSPISLIADGRVVGQDVVVSAAGRIGVVWSGLCGAVGWVALRRRELAQITV